MGGGGYSERTRREIQNDVLVTQIFKNVKRNMYVRQRKEKLCVRYRLFYEMFTNEMFLM